MFCGILSKSERELADKLGMPQERMRAAKSILMNKYNISSDINENTYKEYFEDVEKETSITIGNMKYNVYDNRVFRNNTYIDSNSNESKIVRINHSVKTGNAVLVKFADNNYALFSNGELWNTKTAMKLNTDTADSEYFKNLYMEARNQEYKEINLSAVLKLKELTSNFKIIKEEQDIISQAQANGTYLKAPNKKATNLSPEQWVKVRTKAFKAWFGDWENDPENASKVIDENGEPLVVYHGSKNNTFEVFDASKNHKGYKGFFFTDSEIMAKSYGSTRAFFINSRDPYIIEGGGNSWNDILSRTSDIGKDIIDKFRLHKNALLLDVKKGKYPEESYNKLNNKVFKYIDIYNSLGNSILDKIKKQLIIYKLKKYNFDGVLIKSTRNAEFILEHDANDVSIIFKNIVDYGSVLNAESFFATLNNKSANVYVVTKDTDIKSAIENVEFSRENNNIYKEHIADNASAGSRDIKLKKLFDSNNKEDSEIVEVSVVDIINLLDNSKYSSIIKLLKDKFGNRKEKLLSGIKVKLVSPLSFYKGYESSRFKSLGFDDRRAFYDAESKTIYVNIDADYGNMDSSAVLLHEIMHAITVDRILSNKEAREKFEQILKDYQNSNADIRYSSLNDDALEEFIANIWSDPKTIENLKNIKSSRTTEKSLWDEIKQFFSELFSGIFSGTSSDSLMAEASIEMIKLLESPITVTSNSKFKESIEENNINFENKNQSSIGPVIMYGDNKILVESAGISIEPNNTNKHYGNPFWVNNEPVEVESYAEAVKAYAQWLSGIRFKNIEPSRRKWILEQIESGALNDATLIMESDKVPDNSYGKDNTTFNEKTAPNHGHILQALVKEKIEKDSILQDLKQTSFELPKSTTVVKIDSNSRTSLLSKFNVVTLNHRINHVAKMFHWSMGTLMNELEESLEKEKERLENHIKELTKEGLQYIGEKNTSKSKKEYKNRLKNTNQQYYKIIRYLNLLKDKTENAHLLIPIVEYKDVDGKTYKGIDAIKKHSYLDFVEEQSQHDKDSDIFKEYQKILDNFDALVLESVDKINEYTGLTITKTTETIEDNNGTKNVEISQVVNENSQEESDEEINDDADSYTRVEYSIRKQNPMKSLSKKLKALLASLPALDKDGNPAVDDLGNPQYLNSGYAYATILSAFSEVIDSEDFAYWDTYDEKGNPVGDPHFPLFEKLKDKLPWLENLMFELKWDSHLMSAFYSNFRMHFNKCFAFDAGKASPLNESIKSEVVFENAINNYSFGIELNDISIYNKKGEIVEENINKIIGDIRKLRNDANGILSSSEIDRITNKLIAVIEAIGINPDENTIQSIVKNINNEDTKKSREFTKVLDIISGLCTMLKTKGTEVKDLVSEYKKMYLDLGDIIGSISTLNQQLSFRHGSETRYSYVVPNFLEDTIKILKNPEKRKVLLDEMRQDPILYDKRTNTWSIDYFNDLEGLGEYEDSENTNNLEDTLDTIEILSINGKEIDKITEEEDIASAIRMFWYSNTREPSYFYVKSQLLSDAPVSKWIKVPVIVNGENMFTKESVIDQFLSKFQHIVETELRRMLLVEKRKENGAYEIANFDKQGSKFCFFPELNNVAKQILDKKGEERSKFIRKTLKSILINYIDQEWNTIKGSPELFTVLEDMNNMIFNYGSRKQEETELDYQNRLESSFHKPDNYSSYFTTMYLNDLFARMQVFMITMGDPAYYGGPIDIQKRSKQIYSAGKKLFTEGLNSKKIEKSIIIKDDVSPSRRILNLMNIINSAVNEGRISKEDSNTILNIYLEVNGTDGQTFRTADSMHAILNMLGKSNDAFEDHYKRLKSGKWTMDDFNYVWNTTKAFVYGPTYKDTQVKDEYLSGKLRVMQQHKNSEFVLLTIFDTIWGENNNSPIQRGLDRFMTDYNIDKANYESTVKTGSQGPIDLNYSSKKLKIEIQKLQDENKWNQHVKNAKIVKPDASTDYEYYMYGYTFNMLEYLNDDNIENKERAQEEFDERMLAVEPSEDEVYEILKDNCVVVDEYGESSLNPYTVHEMELKYWAEQQPNDPHLVDTDIVYPTQLNTLVTADLSEEITISIQDKTLNKKETIDLYNKLKIINIINDSDDVSKMFDNKNKLSQYLQNIISNNPKYSKDVASIAELVDGNFKIALHNSTCSGMFEEILTALFRNNVTRQKIKGGYAAVASSVGLTKKLKLKYDEKGNLVGIPCYLPAYTKIWILNTRSTEPGKENRIDINQIPEDLRKIIGVRIPTEDNYSMLPLIIEGFLPPQNGGAIMLPSDITAISGMDFDIDKIYMLFPSFKEVNGEYIKDTLDLNSDFTKSTKAQRDNMLIDIMYQIITSEYTAEKIANPGNFNSLKLEDRKQQILDDPKMQIAFMKKENYTKEELKNKLKRTKLRDLNKFVKDFQSSTNVLTLNFVTKQARQNFAGKSLVGPFASSNSLHAKFQHVHLEVADELVLNIDGVNAKKIDPIYNPKNGRISKTLGSRIGAATDIAKDPVLLHTGYNSATVHIPDYLSRVGMSDETIARFLNLPVIKDIMKRPDILKSWMYDSGKIDPIIQGFINKYLNPQDFENVVYKSIPVDSTVVINTNKLYSMYSTDNSKLSIDDIQYIIDLVNLLYSKILPVADALRNIGLKTKADTRSGGLSPFIDKSKNIIYGQDDLYAESSSSSYPVKSHTGNNDFIIQNEYIEGVNKKDRSSKFMEHPIPQVQAFYSLGVERAMQYLGNYFVEAHPYFMSLERYIKNNIAKSNYAYSQISYHIFQEFYHYLLMGYSEYKNSYNDRKYFYNKEFPFIFKIIINRNRILKGKYEFIRKLNIVGNKIQMNDAMQISKEAIIHMQQEVLEFLKSDVKLNFINGTKISARDLVLHLYHYAYYNRTLGYGPTSFGKIFNSDFISSLYEFNNYEKNLMKKLPQRYINDGVLDDSEFSKFLEQYMTNFGNSGILLSFKKNDKVIHKIEENENDNSILHVSSVVGKEYIIVDNKLYRLVDVYDYNNNVYTLVTDYNKIKERKTLPYYSYGSSFEEFIKGFDSEKIPDKYKNAHLWNTVLGEFLQSIELEDKNEKRKKAEDYHNASINSLIELLGDNLDMIPEDSRTYDFSDLESGLNNASKNINYDVNTINENTDPDYQAYEHISINDGAESKLGMAYESYVLSPEAENKLKELETGIIEVSDESTIIEDENYNSKSKTLDNFINNNDEKFC